MQPSVHEQLPQRLRTTHQQFQQDGCERELISIIRVHPHQRHQMTGRPEATAWATAAAAAATAVAGVWHALGVDEDGHPADEMIWLRVEPAAAAAAAVGSGGGWAVAGGAVGGGGEPLVWPAGGFRIEAGRLGPLAAGGAVDGGLSEPREHTAAAAAQVRLGFDQVYDDGARTRCAAPPLCRHAAVQPSIL